ncbi:MAG: hypothetical protein CM15mP4_3370 [Candidatus Neomarinimicrobiota bacterium]|nr:MAG: hypothetical protein CM15mP4_3370 [Candidatus Neomarinimicrobiota bacterium]
MKSLTNNRTERLISLFIEHINGIGLSKMNLNYKKEDVLTNLFPLSLNAGEVKNVYYTYRKKEKSI